MSNYGGQGHILLLPLLVTHRWERTPRVWRMAQLADSGSPRGQALRIR